MKLKSKVASRFLTSSLLDDVEKYGPKSQISLRDRLNQNMSISDHLKEDAKRYQFLKDYSFAAPDKGALEEIKKFVGDSKVLEIGSGLGLWAKLLQDMGVSVTPTDPIKHRGVYIPEDKTPFTQVHDRTHEDALKEFGSTHDVLMMVWPPYEDSMSHETLRAFKGSKLIYIGEGNGGCTGSDVFHEELQENWGEPEVVRIPQWDGIRDRLYLYKRNK